MNRHLQYNRAKGKTYIAQGTPVFLIPSALDKLYSALQIVEMTVQGRNHLHRIHKHKDAAQIMHILGNSNLENFPVR